MRILVCALYRYVWSVVKPATDINAEHTTHFKDRGFKVITV